MSLKADITTPKPTEVTPCHFVLAKYFTGEGKEDERDQPCKSYRSNCEMLCVFGCKSQALENCRVKTVTENPPRKKFFPGRS